MKPFSARPLLFLSAIKFSSAAENALPAILAAPVGSASEIKSTLSEAVQNLWISQVGTVQGPGSARVGRQKGRQFRAVGQPRARAEPCALQRRDGACSTRALGQRTAFCQQEGQGAVEGVAGPGCVGD